MTFRNRLRRMLEAVTDSFPAKTPLVEEANGGFWRRLLIAVADASPAFQPAARLRDSGHQPDLAWRFANAALADVRAASRRTYWYADRPSVPRDLHDIRGHSPGIRITFDHVVPGLPLSIRLLSDMRMASVSLSGAGLSGADLHGARLRGADLSNADVSGADLSGADLSGADLSGANLSRTDLSGANLADTNLSQAHWSKTTAWPDAWELEIRSRSREIKPGVFEVLATEAPATAKR